MYFTDRRLLKRNLVAQMFEAHAIARLCPLDPANPEDKKIIDAHAAQTAELEKLKGAKPPAPDPKPPIEDPSLLEKIEKERLEKESKGRDTKSLEAALTFNLRSAEFLKTNESILPKDVAEIFKAAEKEKYDTAVERANATKASIIQSFFKIQGNLDLLTESQKADLEDYLKLTKNAKEKDAEGVWKNIFEPSLETMKRVKKAEELGRQQSGYATTSEAEDKYKQNLIKGSRKQYFNEKEA